MVVRPWRFFVIFVRFVVEEFGAVRSEIGGLIVDRFATAGGDEFVLRLARGDTTAQTSA